MSSPSGLSHAGRAVAVAVGYFVGGVAGLSLPFVGNSATLFWPPTGIAVAGLFAWGGRVWPGVWVGSLAVNAWSGIPWWLAPFIATGSALAPAAAAWLLRRVARFDPKFSRNRDVLAFFGVAFAAMTVSASSGAICVCASGLQPWGEFGRVWLVWWLGDAVGVVVFAPPLLIGLGPPERRTAGRLAEWAAVVAVTCAVGLAVFDDRLLFRGGPLPVAFVPLPLLVWAALRLGPSGASWSTALLALTAAWGTSNGRGPFAHPDPLTGLALLWAFLGAASSISLLVTALQAARRRADADRERFFALSLDLLCVAGLDGYFKRVNPSFSRVLGYDAAELLGRPFVDFIHPDDLAATREEVEKLTRGADTVLFENRYRHKDGSWRWLAWTVPAPGPGEDLLYAAARDVTGQKATQDALRQSEERSRLILDQLPALLWTTDADLRFTMSVGKGLEGLGLRPNQSTGMTMAEYFQTSDPEFPVIRAHLLALRGESHQFTSEWAGRSYSSHVRPLRSADGSIQGALGVAMDLTAQKRAEEAARSEQAFIQAVLDNLLGVVYLFDERGRFRRWNRRFVEVSGYSAGELASMTPVDFFAPEDREFIASRVEEVFTRGESSAEVDFVAKGGTRTPYFFTGARVELEGAPHLVGMGIDITKLRAAQAEAHRASVLLQAVVDGTTDAVFVKDREGRYLLFNPAAGRFVGLPPEEVIGKDDTALFDPDGARRVMELDHRVMANGVVETCEDRLTAAGATRVYLSTKAPYRDANGEVVGLIGIARDITDRKRAEETLARFNVELEAQVRARTAELEETARRLQQAQGQQVALLDSIPDIAWLKDDASRFIAVNHAFARTCGHPAESLAGRTDLDIWPADLAEQYRADDRLVLTSGSPRRVEERIIAAGGPDTWAETIKVPIRDDRGRVVGTAGIARDITDRKRLEDSLRRMNEELDRRVTERTQALEDRIAEHRRTEEALRESEGRFRNMADHAPVMIWVTGPDGGCTFLSQSWYEFTGQTPETGLGPGWVQAAHPDDRAYADDAYRGASAQRKPLVQEYRLRRADGEYRWVIDSAAPRFGSAGEFLGYIGSVIDLTERKRAEDAVRAARQMLQVVLDNIPQGVFWKDRDSRYLGCNQVVARGWGFDSPDQIVGRSDRDFPFIRPEQAAFFLLKDREVMDADAPQYNILEPLTRPSGATMWLETSKVPLHDTGGRVVGVLGTWQDVTERKQAREALERSNRLLDALSRSQARFIAESPAVPAFEEMLATLLAVTDSEYGFIGEVLRAADGRPYLKASAITNIAWDDASRAFFEKNAPAGLEFTNLTTLFGAVMTTGEPVIANDPDADPRSGGLPPGHPPLRAFLGLPFHRGADLIGMVGVSNRPGGYDRELVQFLTPFLHTCASMIVGQRNDRARRRAEEANREALAEKEALLKEIHHRVKNNLQVISSLLNLQAERIPDPATQAVFVESQGRVRAMALVHETLYRSGTLARIDLPRYVESLCGHLLRTFGGGSGHVGLDHRVAVPTLDLDRALPCGLIVNELVSNALKYAFPDGRHGRVTVLLDSRPGAGYTLSVRDNGVGLPEWIDLGGKRSLGLHLVSLLVRQLRGTFEVSRSGGTTVTISFPE